MSKDYEKPFLKNLTDIAAVKKYLSRIKAEPRSLDLAIVEEKINDKYWRDKVYVRFKDNAEKIQIYPDEYEAKYKPTPAEHNDIKAQWYGFRHPEYEHLDANLLEQKLLKRHKEARDKDNLFVFYNKNKSSVLMLQEKVIDKHGNKRYIPWTWWDDKQWRISEPPDKLPVYGLEQIGEVGDTNVGTVFIHEGAKGARFCKELINDENASHPWKKELNAIHLGWIGGALNPYRTDWDSVRKVKPSTVYIVPDNDDEGYECVTKISEQMRCLTYSLQYPDGFGRGFDLADPIPERYYDEFENYTGPYFDECVKFATWLTDLEEFIDGGTKKNPKIKRIIKLRPHVRGLWAYIPHIQHWSFTRDIRETHKHLAFPQVIAGFHHGKPTFVIQKLLEHQKRRLTRLAYVPSLYSKVGESVISDGSGLVLNMYLPCRIRSTNGDATLFHKFMAHLIPNREERFELLKWMATIIAKPEVRMKYSVLLISDKKGVGKSTLGESILRHLVGLHNSSIANEKTILSGFNSWAKHKTLVIVDEIYTGGKWKMYNSLKSLVTSESMVVNEKGVKTYDCENMCHFFACSNSFKALKIENDDRRWFIPEVAENLWGKENFTELYNWIHAQGLPIIKGWAENFGHYVHPGDHAMLTHLKQSMIEESLSEPEIHARRIGEILARNFDNETAIIAIEDMKEIIKTQGCRDIRQSNLLLLKACIAGAEMAETGSKLEYIVRPNRTKATSRVYHKGKQNYCLGNPSAIVEFKKEKSNDRFRGEIMKIMDRTKTEVIKELVEM